MANVNFIRKELAEMLPQYYEIRDCIKGSAAVKKAKTKYLPKPNAEDLSIANTKRYDAYVERAVFYNTTQRTQLGLAGEIFSKEPVVEIPSTMEDIKENADGGGVKLIQLAKRCVNYILAYGRGGLLIDYPTTEGVVSKADIDSGKLRPTLNFYKPWKILNWRTTTRGAKKLLSLVVLEEKYVDEDDGFETKTLLQWRVLRLRDDGYTVAIHRVVEGENVEYEKERYPIDFKGNKLQEIPFIFMGCENNDEIIDLPPMHSLAVLNIAHYRNSADYEDSCHLVGQPTPYFTGITEDWVNEVWENNQVTLGSRTAISLPVGGDAGLLQAKENSMPKEAMEQKEKQMVALGAKLVENKQVQRTATEVNVDDVSESSILASTANNVSDGIESGLRFCCLFTGDNPEGIKYRLHTDFNIARMSSNDRNQLMQEKQAGLVTFGEVRTALRKNGIAFVPDEEAKKQIDKELAELPNMNDNASDKNANQE
jgi:hypothetical protein